MQPLAHKHILLGVTGGIAAYKSPTLVRRLRDAGAEVRVVMTAGAAQFITPLTLQAVSGHPVYQHAFQSDTDAMEHIRLARWADTLLIAPASADFLARLAHGHADDLLSTLCLAAEAPPLVAPAMNQAMWANPAVQANVRLLEERGVRLLGPAPGDQACGESGPGRMLEPEELVAAVSGGGDGPLAGRGVLITAGPTVEPLDPVRFLGNRSSGRMGYALARAAVAAGARVELISGPVALDPPAGVERVSVQTAEEMHQAVMARAGAADIFIAAAAVADYRPETPAVEKLKKDGGPLTLRLVPNPDILAEAARAHPDLFCVGFAAETEDLERHAREKLAKKGVRMIAANWVGARAEAAGTGFDHDANAVTVVWDGGRQDIAKAPKTGVAQQLIELIAQHYAPKNPG